MNFGADDVDSLNECGAVVGGHCEFFAGISDGPGSGGFPTRICGGADSANRHSV